MRNTRLPNGKQIWSKTSEQNNHKVGVKFSDMTLTQHHYSFDELKTMKNDNSVYKIICLGNKNPATCGTKTKKTNV